MNLTLRQLFTPPPPDGGAGRGGPTGLTIEFDPPVSRALEEQLGLRLVPSDAPRDVAVVVSREVR